MIKQTSEVSYRYQSFDRVFRFFTTPKLKEGTHKIAIVVEDVVGNSTIPIIITKTLDYFPNAPTNFVATYNSGPKTVTLTWTDPTNSDLSTIRIFSDGGVGDKTPDYLTEIGSAAAGVETFTTGALADGDYVFGIRALDSAGNLETNVDLLQKINVPNAAIPFAIGFQSLINDEGDDEIVLVGIPLEGGKVKLEWEYFQDKINAVVTLFKIYTDSGTGIVDFSSAIGSVVRNSDLLLSLHSFTSARLTDDAKLKLRFVVRGETSSGIDDRNTDFIEQDLFGQIPMPVEEVTGEVVRMLNSEGGFV